jgi:hypothetical protein
MARRFYNNTTATGTIAAAGAGDATFTATGFTGTPTTPFTAIVDRGLASEEVVLVTIVSGGTLTVTRGYDGTSASSHGGGAVIEHVIAAEGPNKWDGHAETTSDTHGVTGVLMGTTMAQTVTSKTNTTSSYDAQGTTSPGTGPLFKARVDTTTRQGFTADTTGTAAAGKAFTAEQSGADRWRVNADGSTITNPSGSPTWAEDCTGNSRVTGNETVTGTATVGALTTTGAASVGSVTSTGAISGTNVTASGTAQQATSTTTGNATVGGTLGVTGATTLATVSSGAITSSGAISGTTITGSGSFSGESAKFTTATVNTDLIRASARFNAPAGALGGAAARDLRQPIVHAGSGSINLVPTTEVNLFEFVFTPKSDCNPAVWYWLTGFCDIGAGAAAATIGQLNLRTRIILDSNGSTTLDAGFNRNMIAIVATADKRARAEVDFTQFPNVVLTGATAYRIRVSAQSDVNLGAAVRVDGWACGVTEIARAV